MAKWATPVVSSSRRFGVDLAPLRVSSVYRRLYLYGLVTSIASQAAYFAMLYQMYVVTHSYWKVGLFGAAELVPLVLFGLYGGVIADHFNRQRIVLLFEIATLLVSIALYVNSRSLHPSIWVLYLVAAGLAACSSVQSPSLAAMTQQLVPHQLQREASILQMVARLGGSILGPVVGSFVASRFSPSTVYLGDVISFGLTLFLLVGIRVDRVTESQERPSLASLRFGARYAATRLDVLGTYAVDLWAMVFAFPIALLPFVAASFPKYGGLTYTLLVCGLPAGALLATVTAQWTGRVHFYGRAVVVSATIWGLGIALFGGVHSLVFAFGGLFVAGAADAVSGIFRMTMWNESIPVDVRGRMASIEMLSYSVGPTAGGVRAGAMAAAVGQRFSLVAGGLICAGGCAAAPAALAELWRFDARSSPDVAAVAKARASETFG